MSRQRPRSMVWLLTAGIAPLAAFIVYQMIIVPRIRAGNERAAFVALKTIATAEADFRANDRDGNRFNDFWTADVSGLFSIESEGKPIALIDRAVAEADAAPLRPLAGKPVPYYGYYFIALERDDGTKENYKQDTDNSGKKVHNNSAFGFCAYPAVYGRTGRQTFYINERNTMFKRDTGGKPMDRWPSDEELFKD